MFQQASPATRRSCQTLGVTVKSFIVFAGCAFGGAVLASFLLVIGATVFMDGESVGALLDRFNGLASLLGATLGSGTFFFTRGRGLLQGRK